MPPSIARSLPSTLARSTSRAIGGARLPWESDDGGSRAITPLSIFGPAALRLWLDYRQGVTLGTPPDVAAWADQSGQGNDAAQGTAADRPDLVDGTGVDFDGISDHIIVPDHASLDFTTALTIGLRLRYTNIGGGGVLLCKSPTTGGAWLLQTVTSAVWLRFGALSNYSITPATLSAGVWYSMIWVYNGAGATNSDRSRFWLNGVEQAQTFNGSIPATIAVTADDLYFGRFNNLAAQHFDGDLKAAVCAAKVSTPADVAALTSYLGGV